MIWTHHTTTRWTTTDHGHPLPRDGSRACPLTHRLLPRARRPHCLRGHRRAPTQPCVPLGSIRIGENDPFCSADRSAERHHELPASWRHLFSTKGGNPWRRRRSRRARTAGSSAKSLWTATSRTTRNSLGSGWNDPRILVTATRNAGASSFRLARRWGDCTSSRRRRNRGATSLPLDSSVRLDGNKIVRGSRTFYLISTKQQSILGTWGNPSMPFT